MSVTPAYFLSLSLSYLRAMIGDSAVWRAIVESPNTDWASLQTLINAGTSSQANALARIKYGRLEDDSSHSDYVSRPRCMLRHWDENDAERAATMGFTVGGLIYVGIELPIPDTYADSFADAYLDAENKVGGIIQNLSAMEPVAGYLHLEQIGLTAFGQYDPDEDNGSEIFVAELAVHHKGSVLP